MDELGAGAGPEPMTPRATLEVMIDKGICMGSQNCVMEAAEIFALSEAGISVVKREVGQGDVELLERIVDMCPSGAVSVKWMRNAVRGESGTE